MIPKQRKNNGYSLVNPYTGTEPEFQTGKFGRMESAPYLTHTDAGSLNNIFFIDSSVYILVCGRVR